MPVVVVFGLLYGLYYIVPSGRGVLQFVSQLSGPGICLLAFYGVVIHSS